MRGSSERTAAESRKTLPTWLDEKPEPNPLCMDWGACPHGKSWDLEPGMPWSPRWLEQERCGADVKSGSVTTGSELGL